MYLPYHRDYTDGISVIDADFKRSGLAAIHMVVERDQAAFVDTGTNSSVPGVLAVMRTKGIAPADVAYVITTHVHLDHAGGAGEMMRLFPNARLVVHPRGARHMIDPEKLIAGVIGVYGAEEVARTYGAIVPVPKERMIEAADGFTLDFNGRELTFLDTPGHARHHFCVVDQRSKSVFAGDTFGISYREFDTKQGEFIFPTTTPVQFDPPALHASIDRLMSYRPRHMYLTHFGQVGDVERLAGDMHTLIDAFVALANRVRGAGPARHDLLIQGQKELLFGRIKQHGCKLSDTEIVELLSVDLELNAQGIGVWLDSQH